MCGLPGPLGVGGDFLDDGGGAEVSGERRRSERVKREKPDYYDALDYENKRKTTPTRAKRERLGGGPGTPTGRSPRFKDDLQPRGPTGRGPGRPPSASSSGRATLTWKKGKGELYFKKRNEETLFFKKNGRLSLG